MSANFNRSPTHAQLAHHFIGHFPDKPGSADSLDSQSHTIDISVLKFISVSVSISLSVNHFYFYIILFLFWNCFVSASVNVGSIISISVIVSIIEISLSHTLPTYTKSQPNSFHGQDSLSVIHPTASKQWRQKHEFCIDNWPTQQDMTQNTLRSTTKKHTITCDLFFRKWRNRHSAVFFHEPFM